MAAEAFGDGQGQVVAELGDVDTVVDRRLDGVQARSSGLVLLSLPDVASHETIVSDLAGERKAGVRSTGPVGFIGPIGPIGPIASERRRRSAARIKKPRVSAGLFIINKCS